MISGRSCVHYCRMGRTFRMGIGVFLCAAGLLLTSCASLQRSADSGVVGRVAALINAGDAKALASLSATPFLVDAEPVVLPADVAAFWADALKAGFRVDGAALDTGVPVAADSPGLFAGTAEVKWFFTRYVPKDARILDLTTTGGAHLRLIVRSGLFSTKLYGFKGPF
ncbi:MAG TPA: hypothetical protein VL359_08195 [bacterium]|nr:hypothetical protein [bacterium]